VIGRSSCPTGAPSRQKQTNGVKEMPVIYSDFENYRKHTHTVSGKTLILFNIVVDVKHTFGV
jgi:hypothetical protein